MVIRRWAFHSQGPLFILFLLLCSHADVAAEKLAEPELTRAPATVRPKPPAAPTPLLLSQLTLPQALALARREHKGLLVEVGASWCQPCKFLEQFIFPHPVIQEALTEVVFVRYDAEVGPGAAARSALSVQSFPTIIALAQDGSELKRLEGIPDLKALQLLAFAAELAKWIKKIGAEAEPTEVIETRLQKEPPDGDALLMLAERYGKSGQTEKRRATLERAVAAFAGKDDDKAAGLYWGLRMDALKDRIQPEQRRFIAEVIARFPRSERADKALRLLVRLGPGDESAVKALSAYIGEHNQDGDAAELTTAVYASLQVGACEPAQKAARQLAVLTQPSGALLAIRLNTLAEVEHMCGDSARALEIEERAIGMVPSDTGESRLQSALQVLKDNQARYQRAKREPVDKSFGVKSEEFLWNEETP